MSGYLNTVGLSVGYSGKPLIRDICLSIRKGEVITLIGPNGGGKSTILKSITGHLRLISGVVTVLEENLHKLGGREMARRISVILTESVAPELMTCREVVESGRYPYTSFFGALTAEDHAIVDESLMLVHALELQGRPFCAISDGQRQRILLARALCQQPDIMVLDEPTSYLDIRHKIEFLDIVRDMAREKLITIIMSMQEVDIASKISDRVICVKGEYIERFGAPEEVINSRTVAELYDMKTGSYNPLSGGIELARHGGVPAIFV
ncbi:MAG: ABC transporter ATP-binding protein, partial [Oscillospiraceae bacterium]|nr:ABC transporter ATP-binding protein [Oscillospiraceae bacterium]